AAAVLAGVGAPPSVVAAHFAALRPAGSAEIVAGLLAAADEALARDAPEIAVALLRRAVDERAPTPSRADLLLKLRRVEVMNRNPTTPGGPRRGARPLGESPGACARRARTRRKLRVRRQLGHGGRDLGTRARFA